MIQNINIQTAERLNIPQACIEMVDYDYELVSQKIQKVTGKRNEEGLLEEIKSESTEFDEPIIGDIGFSADVWANFQFKGKIPSIPLLGTDFSDWITFNMADHKELQTVWENMSDDMTMPQKIEKIVEEYIKRVLVQQLRGIEVR